ncbi:hypothetical protein BC829DRAFT_440162 [Chytridium lagenaria]|nr:hypothetical protein BC829DRAFT_440162 [Chytridium lagenaria]
MESSHPNYPGGKSNTRSSSKPQGIDGKFTLNSGPKRNGIEEGLGTFLTEFFATASHKARLPTAASQLALREEIPDPENPWTTVIPAENSTNALQVCNVGINKPFKDGLKAAIGELIHAENASDVRIGRGEIAKMY